MKRTLRKKHYYVLLILLLGTLLANLLKQNSKQNILYPIYRVYQNNLKKNFDKCLVDSNNIRTFVSLNDTSCGRFIRQTTLGISRKVY